MTGAGSVPLLAVDGLRKAFGGVVAVEDVSFSLPAGSRVALIGPNGAGKSTLFSMLGGQRKPDRGRVMLAGAPVTGLPPHRLVRAGVGRTFQVARVFGSMTLLESVEMAVRAGNPAKETSEGRGRDSVKKWGTGAPMDAAALLHRVGLAALADRPCRALAYGDVKRLELALALACRPRLLLMDEPGAGMARGERLALMDLVAAIASEQGLTILFTEHDMDVVFGHADRVLVLDRGRLIADAAPAAVRADPAVRRVYLGDGAGHPCPKP